MAESRGLRATPARVAELRQDLAALEARLDARIDELRRELREADTAERLAHELGTAALRVLRRPTDPDNPRRDATP